MEKLTLKAQKREGKEKPAKIRRSGQIPAVIYNHGNTDQLTVDRSDINKIFAQGVTESTLIDINVGSDTDTAFIKDYQVHPVSEEILHIDFYRITAGEKIKTSIPLQLEGKPLGVKEGGVLEVFLHDVEIETYPRFLVPALHIDISELSIGDSIHVEDIKLPEETTVMVAGNPIVCQVSTSAKLEADSAATEEGEGEEGEEAAEDASSEAE